LNSLFQSQLFVPISELELSTGYSDIWLKRSHLFPEIPSEWIWELKYVKSSEADNVALIESKRAQAREQLAKYRRSHLFAERDDIRFLSLIFIGKDTYEIEEITEPD
jgi:hypothetical protein